MKTSILIEHTLEDAEAIERYIRDIEGYRNVKVVRLVKNYDVFAEKDKFRDDLINTRELKYE